MSADIQAAKEREKKVEEIIRNHFYPGPVAGSTARLTKALNEYIEAALAEARREVSELRGVVEWIANHRNDGLTDGSAATRACLDEIVNLAAAALQRGEQPGGGEEGHADAS